MLLFGNVIIQILRLTTSSSVAMCITYFIDKSYYDCFSIKMYKLFEIFCYVTCLDRKLAPAVFGSTISNKCVSLGQNRSDHILFGIAIVSVRKCIRFKLFLSFLTNKK